jgi:hypothetical protein
MQPNDLDPTQVSSSNDNKPNTQPSSFGGKVIQPLSSEADIQAELIATAYSVRPSQKAPAPEEIRLSDYATATEPVQHLPEVTNSIPAQSYQTPQSVIEPNPSAPPKKRHTKLIVFLSILGVLVIGLGIAYFIYIRLDSVSVGDLVEEKIQNTTYLRPKQWQPITAGTGSGYGDKLGENGKSAGAVTVAIGASPISGILTSIDGVYDMLRTQSLASLSEEAAIASFRNNGSDCGSDLDFQKEEDTSSTPTTVGLFRISALCHRSDGTVVLHIHGVIGRDGYVRSIIVVASQSNWDKNQDAYKKMLDSLQQG